MKKKIVLRTLADDAEFYDYVKVVGDVDTKFDIGHAEVMRITGQLLDIAKTAEGKGWNINSPWVLTDAIGLLENELGEYIAFQEWNEELQAWQEVKREE